MEREGRPGRADKEGHTHTHTHTHPAPPNTSPEGARPRCPPHRTCKTRGGGQGGKCEERRGGRLTRTERWGSDEVVFFLSCSVTNFFFGEHTPVLSSVWFCE